MSDYNKIAQDFVSYYYNVFDSDRSMLGPLYQPQSMLSFEGQHIQGPKDIVEKLMNLPFRKVAHKIVTIDAQPSIGGQGIIIQVTGELLVDEKAVPHRFSQSFQLAQLNGNYFVHNDLFRLNYG